MDIREDSFLDVRAAATLAGVTTQYIRILLAEKVLVDGGVTGAYTVTRESLEAWMRLRETKKGGKRDA